MNIESARSTTSSLHAVRDCIAFVVIAVMTAACAAAPLNGDHSAPHAAMYPWMPDNGDGTYTNPVIYADYSDPDVVCVDGVYYMVSSSFVHTPGLPVLRSNDLVNWTLIGHVVENLPSPIFDLPQHGKGMWAPSIRYHRGEFYVYVGDPDRGIFMSTAAKAEGPWAPLTLVREAKGWIDPCPLWDDEGEAYLVHGWAKSRAGINSMLTVHRMNAEGTKILDAGTMVFDGHRNHPTIEGPKFYKRNGWYYIFAPAGGVKPGWQTVLRAKTVLGPYTDKIVLAQGTTAVNGPHQGAWVVTPGGRDWFIHFQDRYAYGRIVHLEPMRWKDDWPVIGVDRAGTGCGEPVSVHALPVSAKRTVRMIPQTSDEFAQPRLGLQWQWEANHSASWYSLSARKGALRLAAVPRPDSVTNLWDVPNLLMQKFPAAAFAATACVRVDGLADGDRTGLIVFGRDYALLEVRRERSGFTLGKVTCLNADTRGMEHTEAAVRLGASIVYTRVEVDTNALCRFSYSTDGRMFVPIGGTFRAKEGAWVGAKVGVFAESQRGTADAGYADVDWFRFE